MMPYHTVTDEVPLTPDNPIVCFEYVIRDPELPHVHVHNCMELGYCLDGNGVFLIGGTLSNFGPGDAVVINPGIHHYAITTSPQGSTWRFAFMDPCLAFGAVNMTSLHPLGVPRTPTPGLPPVLSALHHPELAKAIDELTGECISDGPLRNLMVGSLAMSLAVRLHRAMSSTPTDTGFTIHPRLFERVSPALRHIAACYGSPQTLDDLAEAGCLSKSQLTRIFKDALGHTPIDYLNKYRVRVAGSLLRGSDDPIPAIARSVGFTSVSGFNRNFRRFMGMTPTEWRDGDPRICTSGHRVGSVAKRGKEMTPPR